MIKNNFNINSFFIEQFTEMLMFIYWTIHFLQLIIQSESICLRIVLMGF
jgi:hypothetical protein